MSRQSRLVLLLLLSIGVVQLAHSSIASTQTVVHDEVPDNQLDSDEILPEDTENVKISTAKVKVTTASTTTSAKSDTAKAETSTERIISDSVFRDLLEASKHSDMLAKDERYTLILWEK